MQQASHYNNNNNNNDNNNLFTLQLCLRLKT